MRGETLKGDVLTIESGIIVHGVNTCGAFGSGIAGQIRKQYPAVHKRYEKEVKNGDFILGEISAVMVGPDKVIINAATQPTFGYDGKQHVDYDAVRECFKKVERVATFFDLPVHYPMIGCGLGGGKWEIIGPIIDEELKFVKHHLWVYQ